MIVEGGFMHDQMTLDKKFQKELNAGITGLILLSILNRADEPMYGYQISKYLSSDDEKKSIIKQSVIYPVLRSLEKNGMVQSQVEPSVSGPPRRYYSINESGLETLERWEMMWKQTVSFVQNILEGEDHDR